VIVVDTSVWIDFFRDRGSDQVRELSVLIEVDAGVALTDVVLAEVLQGVTTEGEARRVEKRLQAFDILRLTDLEDFSRCAVGAARGRWRRRDPGDLEGVGEGLAHGGELRGVRPGVEAAGEHDGLRPRADLLDDRLGLQPAFLCRTGGAAARARRVRGRGSRRRRGACAAAGRAPSPGRRTRCAPTSAGRPPGAPRRPRRCRG